MDRARFAVLVVSGAGAIALAAQLSVPLGPVPTTLQTLAVVALGLLGGARVGAAAALVYLVGVLAGLPLLSDARTAPGLAFVDFPAGGYVLGFVPATALAGLAARRARFRTLLGAGVLAHLCVLGVGVPWLARFVGWQRAVEGGALPFLVPALIKSAAAAWLVLGYRRLARR